MQGAGAARRRVLTTALKLPEILDGVIQGASVRLVIRQGSMPPAPAAFGLDGLVDQTGGTAI